MVKLSVPDVAENLRASYHPLFFHVSIQTEGGHEPYHKLNQIMLKTRR